MSDRSAYYVEIKKLAAIKRQQFSVDSSTFGLREVRQIYKAEGITIDMRPLTPRLKAIYMCTDDECSVAVRDSLPEIPRLFALVHELKHHWADRELMTAGILSCGGYNENEVFEKAAEVFAAEFIYPEEEFSADIVHFKQMMGIEGFGVDSIVCFKHEACKAKVSYTFIRKRLEWLGHVGRGEFLDARFQKREEELYGIPIYKQPWFVGRRKARGS